MRVLMALVAFAVVTALNLLWWWWPNRPVEIAGWTNAPLQSVSFAPYRPGQSPLTRTFPTPDQIDQDLKRLQGKVRAVRTYSAGENLEAVPQRAGKYGLKVWHGAWLNDNDKENLEQINLLIDHANRYPDTIERVIVGNEVLLRKDLTANQLRGYIRQVKSRVKQPVTYADVWEFWLRNPQLADEVDFITVHLLPYWEDEPIGLDRREPDGSLRIENHLHGDLQAGAGALPRQEDRDRRDRLAERRPHALRRAAGPGRAGALLLDLPRARRDASTSTTTSSRRSTSTGRRARRARSAPPGACSTPSATTSSSSASRSAPSRTGACCSRCRRPCCRPCWCWPSRAGAASRRRARSRSSPCSPRSWRPAYVQSVWIDLSRTFYFEKMVGVAFWALLLGAFSYALLRGIADSLTRRMADPSLYGARVREAWQAWRELPRFRIVQRVDLMLQMLYLVLTVLCIFYLIVITIDWYDGVIRLSDTFFRQIAIDGRYRDFPIWSFVIPSIVLMAWKIMTVLRKEKVPRHERFMQGALVRPAAGLRRQPRATCA